MALSLGEILAMCIVATLWNILLFVIMVKGKPPRPKMKGGAWRVMKERGLFVGEAETMKVWLAAQPGFLLSFCCVLLLFGGGAKMLIFDRVLVGV